VSVCLSLCSVSLCSLSVCLFLCFCFSLSLSVSIPLYRDLCEKLNAGENCSTLVGYSAVYKVCFGMACFFFFFCIFTLRVNSATGCRAAIHNGFWFLKFIALLACCVGGFFLPEQDIFLEGKDPYVPFSIPSLYSFHTVPP
ncbi:unnamed protein product, partial [Oncorhynchus mykiss]